MAAIFHHNVLWKSRHERGGDRAFLEYMLDENDGSTEDSSGNSKQKQIQQVDWGMLYRDVSTRVEEFESMVRVWEVLQWMQDIIAEHHDRPNSEPVRDFYGAALQHYHNDTALCPKRRVERIEIPKQKDIAKVEISIVFRSVGKEDAQVTKIVAVEFVSAAEDTESPTAKPTTIGFKIHGAPTMTADDLWSQLQTNEQDACPSPSPFEAPGVRVLCEAKGFLGFRIYYDARGVSSLGILRKKLRSPATWVSPILGSDSPGRCVADVSLKKVEEVVGTFHDSRLVDLGLRGFGVLPPLCGLKPLVDKEFVDDCRYGPGDVH
ncbi:uncharacterized protein BDV14DRAFT_204274 [Aspergillus stella-maris]|uniref:uncharacterized protein n=1 Tax=Aspergillus stella-maris TaxID=1810926 RepID=UPI003CCDC678